MACRLLLQQCSRLMRWCVSLHQVHAAISTIETAVSNGLQKSSDHTIFGEVFARGELQTSPSGTTGGWSEGVKRGGDVGEASTLASLGLIGGRYVQSSVLSSSSLASVTSHSNLLQGTGVLLSGWHTL